MGAAISWKLDKVPTKKEILQRTVLYGCSLSVLIILYFVADFFMQQIFAEDSISDICVTIIGVFGFPYLKKYFEKRTNRFFFRDDYDYSKAIQDITEKITATIELEALLVSIAIFIATTIKPTHLIFSLAKDSELIYFDENGSRIFGKNPNNANYEKLLRGNYKFINKPVYVNDKYSFKNSEEEIDKKRSIEIMEELGIAGIIPINSKENESIVFIIGQKLSGEKITHKDRNIISVLSRHAGMAIDNALLYKKIKEYNKELEDRVNDRTKRITEMSMAQSEFLADLSHEFQTPISIIQGNIEALKKKKNSASKNEIYVIEATIDRLSRLVIGLLDAAKLRFEGIGNEKQKVKVEEVLADAYEDCKILAENKGVELSFASEIFLIEIQKDKIKEVLLNLISNALKHTPPGGKIVLTSRRIDGEAEIIVSDTGSGIAPRELVHVFERFYRINGKDLHGNGLGLHICRQIIEAHGGTIVAESEVGKGSRFIIRLPLKD